ncbi:hypothetical protein GCM10027570_53720 [Streptomonospora sediminis]
MIRNTVQRLFAALLLVSIAWILGVTALGAGNLLGYFTMELLPLGCAREFASYPAQYDCTDAGLLGAFSAWALVASWLTVAGVLAVASLTLARRTRAAHNRNETGAED